MPFGQHQDTKLWNNQFPALLGVPVSRRMRALVYVACRDKVDDFQRMTKGTPGDEVVWMRTTKAFNTH